MSMLLEALRKSEQRQRARAVPGINTDIPVYATERPGQGRARLWMGGALLVTLAAVAAWYWWPQGDVMSTPPAEPAAAAGPAVAAPEPESEPEAEPAAVSKPVVTPDVARVAENTPARAASQAGNARPRPQPVSPVAELPPSVNPDSADTVAETAVTAPSPAPEQAEMPARTAAVEPGAPEPISYWALPEAVRDQLPEMKISVLVFAGEPADRFVLMNGRRLTEGAQLQDGLSLEQVRRDGAVMRFKMYRFLVRHN